MSASLSIVADVSASLATHAAWALMPDDAEGEQAMLTALLPVVREGFMQDDVTAGALAGRIVDALGLEGVEHKEAVWELLAPYCDAAVEMYEQRKRRRAHRLSPLMQPTPEVEA